MCVNSENTMCCMFWRTIFLLLKDSKHHSSQFGQISALLSSQIQWRDKIAKILHNLTSALTGSETK